MTRASHRVALTLSQRASIAAREQYLKQARLIESLNSKGSNLYVDAGVLALLKKAIKAEAM